MLVSEVFNCDCLAYMKGLPDGHFALAVADPPYADAGQGFHDKRGRYGGRFDRYKKRDEHGEILEVDWDVAPPQEFWDELFRVSQNQIVWGANHFSMPPTKCFVVWRKATISEDFSMAMAEYAWTSFDTTPKVYEAMPQRDQKDMNFHPTQKPIGLYAWLYRRYANPGDTIFDPMMGSQSSRIAAHFAGLDFYGCEIDKDYFEKGNERYERMCRGVEREGGITIIQPTLFND